MPQEINHAGSVPEGSDSLLKNGAILFLEFDYDMCMCVIINSYWGM